MLDTCRVHHEDIMDFMDIIKFFNEMAEKHDGSKILKIARQLVHRLLVGVMLMLARQRADRLLAALKRMKRTIKKDIRKMKRHQHETRKKARRAIQGYKSGAQKGAKVPARGTLGNAKHVQLRLQRAAVVSVHEFVKNAKAGRFEMGESVRILINLAKVVHHLPVTAAGPAGTSAPTRRCDPSAPTVVQPDTGLPSA